MACALTRDPTEDSMVKIVVVSGDFALAAFCMREAQVREIGPQSVRTTKLNFRKLNSS